MVLSLALSNQREVVVLDTMRSEMQRIVDKHWGLKGLQSGLYKFDLSHRSLSN